MNKRRGKRKKSAVRSVLLFCLIFAALLFLWFGGKYLLQRFGGYFPDAGGQWFGEFVPGDVICIDAGHGGSYSGATYEGRMEKDDTLRLSLEVERVLKQQGQKVVMTRSGDDDIGLRERTVIANKHRAFAFVSIHRNSGETGAGVEVWVHSDAPEEDMEMASQILNHMDMAGIQQNRGVKTGYRDDSNGKNYAVNRDTKMPSCLVEVGFMQNAEDNRLFDEKLKPYAKAIAQGIMESNDIPFDETKYTVE